MRAAPGPWQKRQATARYCGGGGWSCDQAALANLNGSPLQYIRWAACRRQLLTPDSERRARAEMQVFPVTTPALRPLNQRMTPPARVAGGALRCRSNTHRPRLG